MQPSIKPVWTLVSVRLCDLVLWELNPRISTESEAKRIIKSEVEFGQVLPIIISPFFDTDKSYIYDGHQRVQAWTLKYGINHIVQAYQADRFLSEDERKKLTITLHAGATGEWDWNLLSSWSADELSKYGMSKDYIKPLNNDAMNLRLLYESEVMEIPTFEQHLYEEESLKTKTEILDTSQTCPSCGHCFVPV